MRKLLAAFVIALSFGFVNVPSAVADSAGGLVLTSATVGGQDVASTNWGTPLRLVPGEAVDVELLVANHGDQAVHIRRADLSGRVLGLVFFSYLAPLDVSVAPGATEAVRYRLELIGLDGQAVGLMRGDVSLVGDSGDRIALLPVVSDVRGSMLSIYGVFGLTLLVLTVLASVDAALAIRRHRLSDNRWLRGLRLLTPGIGVGLVLLFTATVLRVWIPQTPMWLTVSAGIAAAFFTVGFFTPTADHRDDGSATDEDVAVDDEVDIDEARLATTGIDNDGIGDPALVGVG